MWQPGYVELASTGELAARAGRLAGSLKACSLCPHQCGAHRLNPVSGQSGAGSAAGRCASGVRPIVSAYCLHMGEEPALGGSRGVGNIFFGNCNAACVYCQNYLISQRPFQEAAREVSTERLADIMLDLAGQGAASVGFVSPSHFAAQAIQAIGIAVSRGFSLPLIYNSNGYDSVTTLKSLEGVFEIYLPDLRYASAEAAVTYSALPDYPRIARLAIKEMHRQVGSRLVYGDDGLVKRGLIIRLLVLPNGISGTEQSLRWIADELGTGVCVSVMSQYYPTNRAKEYPQLARGITRDEYDRVVEVVDDLGFSHGWLQEYDSGGHYRPDFSDRIKPFKP